MGPPPPPSLERMKRNGRDGVPLATSDNQPRDGDHGGKKVSLGGTVSFGGVGDPKIGTEESDEAVDDDVLGPKTMEQLVPRRGVTATKTGGEAPNRRGRRTRPRTVSRRGRRGSLDFFFVYTRSSREDGNVDNAVRDGGGGISMVHRCGLKNLLILKVSF